jgi:hypothetical protein
MPLEVQAERTPIGEGGYFPLKIPGEYGFSASEFTQ